MEGAVQTVTSPSPMLRCEQSRKRVKPDRAPRSGLLSRCVFLSSYDDRLGLRASNTPAGPRKIIKCMHRCQGKGQLSRGKRGPEAANARLKFSTTLCIEVDKPSQICLHTYVDINPLMVVI